MFILLHQPHIEKLKKLKNILIQMKKAISKSYSNESKFRKLLSYKPFQCL